MTAILGGGISGLSAAFYALENPKLGPLTLLEASNRYGGWLQSNRLPNGVVYEKGPRTVRPIGAAGQNTLDLIDRLKLTNSIKSISSKHPAARNRLIYVDKKLHVLPSTLSDAFKIMTPFRRPLIMALWNDFRAPMIKKDDESIYSFIERRLGKDVAKYIISPAICGICAGNANKISVNFLMSTFFEAEQNHGSILKGIIKNTQKRMREHKNKVTTIIQNNGSFENSAEKAINENWSVWTLKDGLEELPKKLVEHLSTRNVNLSLNARCNNLTFKLDGVELEVNNSRTQYYTKVISSLPARNLASLIQRQHPKLAEELNAIPTVTVGVVNFQFDRNILQMEAFGFLIPPSMNLPILGVIFDSCVITRGPTTVLTVMMGGDWFEHYFGKNPTKDYLSKVALENVRMILNVKDDPVDVDVSVLENCIPQYIVGHKQRINRIYDYISSHNIPLILCGSSYRGIGINDVILSAKNAVDDISFVVYQFRKSNTSIIRTATTKSFIHQHVPRSTSSISTLPDQYIIDIVKIVTDIVNESLENISRATSSNSKPPTSRIPKLRKHTFQTMNSSSIIS